MTPRKPKRYPKPNGTHPTPGVTCPACGAPPNVPHSKQCPWILWANSPREVTP